MEAGSALKSFIEYTSEHHFPLENIPFGTFKNPETNETHCCTRVGDFVVDLAVLHERGHFAGDNLKGTNVFASEFLNDFMALARPAWTEARATIQNLFAEGSSFKDDEEGKAKALFAHDKVEMTLPVRIGDYTDFYSSKNHAYNVGCIVRGPDNALQPNYLHIPVGYHGRSSSIVVSGTDIRRPKGQVSADKKTPTWSDCKRLDFELEMGAYVGVGNEMGKPIKIENSNDHIFGLSLLNDWSARDVQVWEYVPLGPFNAKNFASTVSPWIITLEALEPFKIAHQVQDPEPLPYLKEENPSSYNIDLHVGIQSESMDAPHEISVSNFKHLYWNVNQQLTHHAVTGCNMNTGDFLGSGTISGTEKSEYGWLLELSWAGKEKVSIGEEERVFLKDGDSVHINGVCKGEGFTVGFGDCIGKVLPALDDKEYF